MACRLPCGASSTNCYTALPYLTHAHRDRQTHKFTDTAGHPPPRDFRRRWSVIKRSQLYDFANSSAPPLLTTTTTDFFLFFASHELRRLAVELVGRRIVRLTALASLIAVAEIPRDQLPRSILVGHIRHARFPREALATSSRGRHEDATRQLIPWNFSDSN